jgi:hypothetical protein
MKNSKCSINVPPKETKYTKIIFIPVFPKARVVDHPVFYINSGCCYSD